MAKPPSLQRVNIQDLQGAPDWFERFLVVANPFFGSVTSALNGGLGGENLRRQVETVTLTTRPVVEDTFANNRLVLKNKLGTKPTEVRIGQVSAPSLTPADLAIGLPIWGVTSSGQIAISYIGGLQASTKYTFVFVIE